MTVRQRELLQAIRRYQRKHGYTPTMAELFKKLKKFVVWEIDGLVRGKLAKRDGASIVVLVPDADIFQDGERS